jgi:5'-phosphate synthase pdxT subunit
MNPPVLGVLALQGGFALHQAMLKQLRCKSVLVKAPADLTGCKGLIIPGGESTTMTKLIQRYHLYEPLREFAQAHPIMGTCAGAILVASAVDDERISPLGLMDIDVIRNVYGRQRDSFMAYVHAAFLDGSTRIKSIFIRAPKIRHVGPEVNILMALDGSPIMVQQNRVLALTFHPELTDDLRIHRYFVQRCTKADAGSS